MIFTNSCRVTNKLTFVNGGEGYGRCFRKIYFPELELKKNGINTKFFLYLSIKTKDNKFFNTSL